MVKVRNESFMVDFIDMEKSYDRVNRKKLFEVMRRYGLQGMLVYAGSMVKLQMESLMTG